MNTGAAKASLTITLGVTAVILATQFIDLEPNTGIAVFLYILGVFGMLYGFNKLSQS